MHRKSFAELEAIILELRNQKHRQTELERATIRTVYQWDTRRRRGYPLEPLSPD